VLSGSGVLGEEDHAEGTMIERRDGEVTAIEELVLCKLVPQAIHVGGGHGSRHPLEEADEPKVR
jgi:hypothetical protein